MSYRKGWRKLEKGQAMVEYWPVFPIAVAILIGSGVITEWLKGAYLTTNEGLCRAGLPTEQNAAPPEESLGPTVAEMGNHRIELIASSYDDATDETTVVYRVTPGTSPCISHWVLGVPSDVASEIYDTSEVYEWTNNDPTTHIAGIKFDTGYDAQCSAAEPEQDKPKGNNGVGNGEDPQPPGNPPVNDGEGTGPGNPGNKGGPNDSGDNTNNGNDNPKGNNGVGNGEDPQPPGEPPINDGEGTSPGNPGNKGGPKDKTAIETEIASLRIAPRFGRSSGVTFYGTIPSFSESGGTEINISPTGDSREIAMVLTGNYTFETVDVSIKAGTDTYTSSILAPVSQSAPEEPTEETAPKTGCD